MAFKNNKQKRFLQIVLQNLLFQNNKHIIIKHPVNRDGGKLQLKLKLNWTS